MYAAKAAYIFPWYLWVLLLILFLRFFPLFLKLIIVNYTSLLCTVHTLKIRKVGTPYFSWSRDPFKPLPVLCYVFCLDFCKVFDMISHNILLSKLELYGFDGCIGEWTRIRLNSLIHRTEVTCSVSRWALVTNGVPQVLWWDWGC